MEIKYIKVIETFEDLKEMCWSDALKVLEQIEKKGLEDNLMDLLQEFSYEEPWESDTQINDFIWFDLENYEDFKNLWED